MGGTFGVIRAAIVILYAWQRPEFLPHCHSCNVVFSSCCAKFHCLGEVPGTGAEQNTHAPLPPPFGDKVSSPPFLCLSCTPLFWAMWILVPRALCVWMPPLGWDVICINVCMADGEQTPSFHSSLSSLLLMCLSKIYILWGDMNPSAMR